MGSIQPIRSRQEFLELNRSGRRLSGAKIGLIYLPGNESVSLALAVPKRRGSAVERNKFRRRVKAAFNTVEMREGSYLVYPRVQCEEMTFADIVGDLTKLSFKTAGF